MHATTYFIVLNAGSGHAETELQRTTIEQALTRAGRPYQLAVVDNPSELDAVAQRMVDQAKACGGTIVAAGGDGTINAVAHKAVASGCPFGVLPQGTFNYFGRAHGIPEDLEQAVQSMLDARPHPVQVGLVNDRVFLVNASIGLYPRVLEEREHDKSQYGRSRLVALLSMLKTALGTHQFLRIRLEVDGKERKLRTPTLFIGNNPLQMQQLGIDHLSAALEEGELAAIAPRSVGKLGMLWLMLRGAAGKLGGADDLSAFRFKRIIVKPLTLYGTRRRIKVATDGEVTLMNTPLVVRVLEGQLMLLKPDAPQQDRAAHNTTHLVA
jgi:diacylglycerol kinase family enzyme